VILITGKYVNHVDICNVIHELGIRVADISQVPYRWN
jgi:hypothetical protein